MKTCWIFVVSAALASSAFAGAIQKGVTGVKREDGKVWVENVPELKWGLSGECTFIGALCAALDVTSNKRAYTDLMGVSGLAFRTRWYKDGPKWCPSSPVGELPAEMKAIEKAIGAKFGGECLLDQKKPDMTKFAPQIVKSIDMGMPVLAYEPKLNMAVIYGYKDDGKTVMLRDYMQGTHELPTADLGAYIVFIEKGVTPSTPRVAAIDALKMAVASWDKKKDGFYRLGGEALRQWATDIRSADKLTDEQKAQLFFVGWWNFEALVDARGAAAKYLAGAARQLGPEAEKSLTEAAGIYEREAGMLAQSAFAKGEAFFGPWSGKVIGDWTPQVRAKEAALLEECLKLETKAIGLLRKAVSAVKS